MVIFHRFLYVYQRVSSVNFGAELYPHDMVTSPICLMIILKKNKPAGVLNDVEMVECREQISIKTREIP